MDRRTGFALIEMLVAAAIVTALAAVLSVNLLGARDGARERPAEAYAAQVYGAAIAYLAEDPDARPVLGGCRDGYVAGAYAVPAPPAGAITTCVVSDPDGDGSFGVEVALPSGRVVRVP